MAAPAVRTATLSLEVSEPSSLNEAGADRATLSGWSVSDDGSGKLTVDASWRGPPRVCTPDKSSARCGARGPAGQARHAALAAGPAGASARGAHAGLSPLPDRLRVHHLGLSLHSVCGHRAAGLSRALQGAGRWRAWPLLRRCLLFVPWQNRISAPGVVHAGIEQALFSPYGARLVPLDLVEGANLTPGQVLLTLDADRRRRARQGARHGQRLFAGRTRSAGARRGAGRAAGDGRAAGQPMGSGGQRARR